MKSHANSPMTSIELFPELDEFQEKMVVPSEPRTRIVYHFTKDFMDNINYFSKQQSVESQSENSLFDHKCIKNEQIMTYDCIREKQTKRISNERKMKIKNMNFSGKKIVRFEDPEVKPVKSKKQRIQELQTDKKKKNQISQKSVKQIKYLKRYPKSSLLNSILQIFLSIQFFDFSQRKFNKRPSSLNLFHEYKIIKDLYLIENTLPVPTQQMFNILQKLYLNIEDEDYHQKANDFLDKLLQKLNVDFKSYERFQKQKEENLNFKRKSIIEQIFQGEIKTVRCCSKCNNVDVKISSFYTMKIEVKKDESIQSLFRQQFSQKIFANNCIHCYCIYFIKIAKQSIILTLRKFPKILVLSLESKYDILRREPLEILKLSISKDRTIDYKLNSLVGYCKNDFFYSIIQINENEWNRFSNQKVRRINKGCLIQNEDRISKNYKVDQIFEGVDLNQNNIGIFKINNL